MIKKVMIMCVALATPIVAKAQTGVASWYGPGFHGKTTANGERYNQNGISCAHRTAKLGSYIRVTNLSNGKTTSVKVNDRGPYSGGRILDMSKGLKNKLGCSDLCKVRVG